MKKLFIFFVLVGSSLIFIEFALAENISQSTDCKSNRWPVKVAGFLGYNQESKKIRTIAHIVTPNTDQKSVYERVLEVGQYRFIRENQNSELSSPQNTSQNTTKASWQIYRRNNKDGAFVLRKDLQFPVKVSVDEPLYVSVRSDQALELRRNTDDVHSTSVTFQFSKDDTTVKDAKQATIAKYDSCSEDSKNLPEARSTSKKSSGSKPVQTGN